MKHIISLVVGDWSGDGHDKKETINIRSNLDKKEMENFRRMRDDLFKGRLK